MRGVDVEAETEKGIERWATGLLERAAATLLLGVFGLGRGIEGDGWCELICWCCGLYGLGLGVFDWVADVVRRAAMVC